jgi:MATE family multidrug resistance protein
VSRDIEAASGSLAACLISRSIARLINFLIARLIAPMTSSARRIAPLAWPVFVGQVSVLAFGTIDTVLVARHAAVDLAALAVGGAAYITVFIGLMGVVLAISPIVGQLYGAGKLHEAGRQVHQGVWVALALALLGCSLLAFPAPFLALAQATPEVETRVRGYLLALAVSLPAALLFTIYRGFNTAVSRPKMVMLLQLGSLGVKIPLSVALVAGVPSLGIPALGVVGCGIATAVALWSQLLAALVVLARDPFYRRFQIFESGAGLGRGWGWRLDRPDFAALRAYLKLGVPMGASILVEVTAFAFIALFIARLGMTAVAGHHLAMNLLTIMFMMPLAIGNATATLVAQRVGAHDPADARRLAWHGLWLGVGVATLMGTALFLGRAPVLGLYTQDTAVLAAALPLLTWVVLFHIADAVQVVAAFVLRAFKIATLPMLIYVAALWGVGLGGGYVLAFNLTGSVPAALQGAPGFWFAATAGLVVAGLALAALLAKVLRAQEVAAGPAFSAAAG